MLLRVYFCAIKGEDNDAFGISTHQKEETTNGTNLRRCPDGIDKKENNFVQFRSIKHLITAIKMNEMVM